MSESDTTHDHDILILVGMGTYLEWELTYKFDMKK